MFTKQQVRKALVLLLLVLMLVGFFYVDSHYLTRSQSDLLSRMFTSLLLIYYVFFRTPRLEARVKELEEQLRSEADENP